MEKWMKTTDEGHGQSNRVYNDKESQLSFLKLYLKISLKIPMSS